MSENVKITLEPEVTKVASDVVEVNVNTEIKDEKEAKKFLEGFMGFVNNGSMEKKAEEISARTGLPAKEISKNFALKALGILGTALEVGVNTAGDVIATLINLIGRLLLGGVELIIRTAQRIVRIVTLNQGAKA